MYFSDNTRYICHNSSSAASEQYSVLFHSACFTCYTFNATINCSSRRTHPRFIIVTSDDQMLQNTRTPYIINIKKMRDAAKSHQPNTWQPLYSYITPHLPCRVASYFSISFHSYSSQLTNTEVNYCFHSFTLFQTVFVLFPPLLTI